MTGAEILSELRREMDLRFDLNHESVDQARSHMERRLEDMNEFREQLRHQASTFVTRELLESEHRETCIRLDELEKILADIRLNMGALQGRLIGAVVTLTVVFTVFQLASHLFKFLPLAH